MFSHLGVLRRAVAIRANLLWKSAELPVSGQTGDGPILYLASARLKVP